MGDPILANKLLGVILGASSPLDLTMGEFFLKVVSWATRSDGIWDVRVVDGDTAAAMGDGRYVGYLPPSPDEFEYGCPDTFVVPAMTVGDYARGAGGPPHALDGAGQDRRAARRPRSVRLRCRRCRRC